MNFVAFMPVGRGAFAIEFTPWGLLLNLRSGSWCLFSRLGAPFFLLLFLLLF